VRTSAVTAIALLRFAASLTPVVAQDPLFDLDTLHVDIGSRTLGTVPAATRSVGVLDPRQLQRLPAHSLNEALDWTLGVDRLD